jgi:hypothetical protein
LGSGIPRRENETACTSSVMTNKANTAGMAGHRRRPLSAPRLVTRPLSEYVASPRPWRPRTTVVLGC